MKKLYQLPEMTVLTLEKEDVITTSFTVNDSVDGGLGDIITWDGIKL